MPPSDEQAPLTFTLDSDKARIQGAASFFLKKSLQRKCRLLGGPISARKFMGLEVKESDVFDP